MLLFLALICIKLRNILLTTDDINKIVSKLEKLEIIGEKILKYWEKNFIYYKLDITNSDINQNQITQI